MLRTFKFKFLLQIASPSPLPPPPPPSLTLPGRTRPAQPRPFLPPPPRPFTLTWPGSTRLRLIMAPKTDVMKMPARRLCSPAVSVARSAMR